MLNGKENDRKTGLQKEGAHIAWSNQKITVQVELKVIISQAAEMITAPKLTFYILNV